MVSTVRACFSGSLIFECKTKSVVFWREFKLKIQNRFFKAGEKGTSSPFPQTSIVLTVNKSPAVLLFIRESHVYSKRQTPDSRREFLRMENKQIKTAKTILMDKTGVKLLIFVQK